ncbi:MAG: cytochrome c oxidase accessory protein CcoG [Deltaproteobacteria bacterium]|nr:cytochrome c oxidase accessory protein CcoG [Deltaproteobacteria bacterium]
MADTTEKRVKIYPKSVSGRFRSVRWAVSALLLGIYFILPWVRYDGHPALLFDIPGRKFYIFNLIIWPQEVYYLAILLVFLVFSLFFFTALAGRLWCGYACPQTLFTDIFMLIEKFIEGDRRERITLDKGSWTIIKIGEKAAKHSLWIAFSFFTAFTFVAYFVPASELFERLATFTLTSANLFWLGFFTFTTYMDCAFLRELMCLVPCPYGRFQSALFDQDTLIIGYDQKRGEPRGHKKDAQKGAGDCVNCTLCVQVCPTGIDIRNGLQYECIACAQCVDACNSVMDKLGLARGLIRYGSLRSIAGGATKVLRPRMFVYAVSLVLLVSTFTYKLSVRKPLDLDVLRERSSLYQRTEDGRISNMYTIKAMNMDRVDHKYMIKTEGLNASMRMGANPITVKSGEVYKTYLALVIENGITDKKVTHFDFVIEDVDNPRMVARRGSTFLTPDTADKHAKVSLR